MNEKTVVCIFVTQRQKWEDQNVFTAQSDNESLSLVI